MSQNPVNLKQVKKLEVGGYSVTIERLDRGTGRKKLSTCGVKTRLQCQARQKATVKDGFLRVVKVIPLSPEDFARQFPARKNTKQGNAHVDTSRKP